MATSTLDQTDENVDVGPDPKRFVVLAVVAIAQLMLVLDASVVIVALPSAQQALHISIENRQWVVSAYTLAFGSLLLLGGRIADYLGRRRMFIVGLLGFVAASALGGLAQDSAMLFSARGLQGAFAALMAPAALSILTVTFTEPSERAKAFGVYGGISGGGAAIGLILGGVLTQLATWRWTLLINVPIGLIAVVAARRVIPESRGERGKSYDIAGAIAVTTGLFLLVYGFTLAAIDGWSSTITLALLGSSIVALGAFVAIELRTSHPLLPLSVVYDRNRGGAYLTSLLVGCALLGTFLFLTYFFQGTLHYSALKTGFAFLPFSGGVIVGAALSSRWLPKVGPRAIMVSGLVLAAAGLAWFTRLTAASSYVTHILPGVIVVSFGLGLTFVAMSSTALAGVDPHHAGVASALVNATQQVGSSLGTALLNTIAASATATYLATHLHTASAVAEAPVHGYTTGFTVSAILMVAAAATAALLVRAAPRDLGPETELVPELAPAA